MFQFFVLGITLCSGKEQDRLAEGLGHSVAKVIV